MARLPTKTCPLCGAPMVCLGADTTYTVLRSTYRSVAEWVCLGCGFTANFLSEEFMEEWLQRKRRHLDGEQLREFAQDERICAAVRTKAQEFIREREAHEEVEREPRKRTLTPPEFD